MRISAPNPELGAIKKLGKSLGGGNKKNRRTNFPVFCLTIPLSRYFRDAKKLQSDFAPGPRYRGKTDFWTLKFSDFGAKCHIWRHLAAAFINLAGTFHQGPYKGCSVKHFCKFEPPSTEQSGVAGRQIIDIMQYSQCLDLVFFRSISPLTLAVSHINTP